MFRLSHVLLIILALTLSACVSATDLTGVRPDARVRTYLIAALADPAITPDEAARIQLALEAIGPAPTVDR